MVSRPIRARSGISQVVCILLSVSVKLHLMETVSRSLPAAGLMELIDQAKLALGELETCVPRGRDRRANSEIASMKVAFVVVRNDTVQCLLEVFATVSLKARFNSFRTT